MFIRADWPAPHNINAITTLRTGGVSKGHYESFNLAEHVADQKNHVKHNRETLKNILQLNQEPFWLQQTHSTISLPASFNISVPEADASYTHEKQLACVVLTADCVPILLCNQNGTEVAAIHAGWKGLLNGIIEATLENLNSSRQQLLAWLGPAISAPHYEVGEEVRKQFLDLLPEAAFAFTPSPNQRWFADLYALARLRLKLAGVSGIYGGTYCTYREANRFYSYRRDGEKTGRMASLIWISE